MKPETWSALRVYLIELVIYAALVVAYFFLVLHFLGDSLLNLFQTDRQLYAFVALGLIVGQGLLLEIITRALLRAVRGKGARK